MNDMNKLEQLAPIADEMLSGLHADETMKRRILYAAREEKTAARKTPVRRFAPALCCAALAIACVGAVGLRLSNAQKQPLEPVAISSIAAGDNVMENSVRVADAGVRRIIFCRFSSASVTAAFLASGLSTDRTQVR